MGTTNFKTAEEICADIKENILNLSYYEIMAIHNQYCELVSYHDDIIFENDAYIINELFSEPFEAIRSMYYGDYSPNHEFFKFNGYGNLQSIADYNLLDYVDIKGIVQNIIEDPYNYMDIVNFLTSEYIESIEMLK